MDEFQIGDKVRLLKPEDMNAEVVDDIGFNDEMFEMVGEVHTIVGRDYIKGYIVYRIDGQWIWASEWLELVEPNTTAPAVSEEDFASVFN